MHFFILNTSIIIVMLVDIIRYIKLINWLIVKQSVRHYIVCLCLPNIIEQVFKEENANFFFWLSLGSFMRYHIYKSNTYEAIIQT